jgi:hypothetical protein
MIFEVEDKKYDIGYGTFDEKISSLKRNKVIKVSIPLKLQMISHSLAFDYFKSLTTIDKVKVSKHNYSWVFLNCTIDKIHLAPTKYEWGYDKVLKLDIIFEDVIGSHNDELIKGKIRDKKLNELFHFLYWYWNKK